MQPYGFHFAYRLYGGQPTIRKFIIADTETLTAGDLVEIESDGHVDLAASGDDMLTGAVVKTVSGTADTTEVLVICDPDAVYAVTDANARVMGATLDISGATGRMTVGNSSNADVRVVADSTATEPTYVMINHGVHPLSPDAVA